MSTAEIDYSDLPLPIGEDGPDEDEIELPRECLEAPLTDAGNAEVLSALVGRRIRFDHERQEWFAFVSHHWAPIPESRIGQMALKAVRLRGEAARRVLEEHPGDSWADAVAKWALRSESARGLDALVKVARALDELNAVTLMRQGDTRLWDYHSQLLGVRNGVVDLRTGEFREGRPQDRITLQTGVAYDPTATCPRWERFMVEVLPDPETREWRRRFAGYSITGSVREEKLVFDVGSGSNGKSTFYGVIREILGGYYWPLQASVLLAARRGAHTTELTDLEGRRVVNVIEMTENATINEERVKSIVSVDPITARRMRRDSRTYLPTHTLWLGTNNLPGVKDPTEGLWRRVKVVPWTQAFPVNDAVKSELRAELPGILRWLVQAAQDYIAHGLPAESAEMSEAATRYREGEDELGDWIAARVVEEEGAFLQNTEAMKDYVEWSRTHGTLPMHQVSAIVFGRTMAKRYTATKITRGGRQMRGFVGIKLALAPVAMDADDPRANWGLQQQEP